MSGRAARAAKARKQYVKARRAQLLAEAQAEADRLLRKYADPRAGRWFDVTPPHWIRGDTVPVVHRVVSVTPSTITIGTT